VRDDQSVVSQVGEQKFRIGTLDGCSMRIDIPEYLFSNDPITRLHYGKYQATIELTKFRGGVGWSKTSTVVPFGRYSAY